MTAREFWEWAKVNNAEDAKITVIRSRDCKDVDGVNYYFDDDPDGRYDKEADRLYVY